MVRHLRSVFAFAVLISSLATVHAADHGIFQLKQATRRGIVERASRPRGKRTESSPVPPTPIDPIFRIKAPRLAQPQYERVHATSDAYDNIILDSVAANAIRFKLDSAGLLYRETDGLYGNCFLHHSRYANLGGKLARADDAVFVFDDQEFQSFALAEKRYVGPNTGLSFVECTYPGGPGEVKALTCRSQTPPEFAKTDWASAYDSLVLAKSQQIDRTPDFKRVALFAELL